MKTFALFAIVVCLLAGSQLSALSAPGGAPSYNGWTSGAFWGGGYVQNVVLCPSDTRRCYAYIDMAGAYRSDDGGMTWRMLHGAFPPGVGFYVRGLTVDPRNADDILLVLGNSRFAKGYLLSSRDGGIHFRVAGRVNISVEDNPTGKIAGFIIDRNPTVADEILVGDYDGVQRSVDNGKTWSRIWQYGRLNTSDLRFDKSNPKRVWLCSQRPPEILKKRFKLRSGDFETGIFRSEDGGASWRKISDEGPSEIVQSNADPEKLYGIFQNTTVKRSIDKGKSWTEFSCGLTKEPVVHHDRFCNKDIYTAIGAGPDFIVVANTHQDFFRLDRGSKIWKRIAIQKIDPRDYLGAAKIHKQAFMATASITIDPSDPAHWFATDFYNVMQTFDGGKTWSCTSTGMSQVVMKSVFVLPGTHDFLVSLMDHNWYVTRNGGRNYQQYPGFGYERMYFQAAPSDPNVIYTSGPRASVVSVSRDGGKTWKIPALRGLPPRRYGNPAAAVGYVRASVAVDPKNPNLLYLGIAQDGRAFNPAALGVYASSDGGENWHRMSDGLPAPTHHPGKSFFENTNVCGYELAVSKQGTPVAMSIVYNLVCRWDGERKRWETVRSDPEHPWGLADLQTAPFTGRLWLAAKSSGLFYSDDDGRNWNRLENFDGMAGRMFFDRERLGRFTVSSDKGLYLTEDNGESWWFYDFDGKQPGRGINAVAAIAGEVILLATEQSGVFYHRIERNPDGSPKGFCRRKPEKTVARLSQISDFFGTGTLRLLPADGVFSAADGKHTSVFGVKDSGSIRVECPSAANYATAASGKLTVRSGCRYRLTFQARGNVTLTSYLNDNARRNFPSQKLRESWMTFSVPFIPAADTLSLAFLVWRQQGWFELRDLELAAE